MKRFVVLLVVVLVAGLSLFAVWAGVRARATYAVAVHASGAHPDVRVIESELDPGWIRSTATTTFEVHGQVGAAFRLLAESLGAEAVRPRLGFRLRHELLHGPASLWSWIATGFPGLPSILEVHTFVELDQESAREASQVIGTLPTMVASTWVRLGGETETHLFVDAGSAEPKSEMRRASWQPLDGSIVPEGRRIASLGRIASVSGIGQTLEFRARGIEWEADAERHASAPARVALRIHALGVRHRVPDAPWIEIHDLEIGQGAAASYGSQAHQAYARFVRADLNGTVYGPGRLEIVAEGLGGSSEAEEPAEPDRAVQRVQRGLRLLPGFIVQAPRSELTRVLLNGPSGSVRGGGELRSDEQGSLRSALLDLELPIAMLEDLRRAWNPAGGEQPEPWFVAWEAKGLLVRSEDRYRLRARVHEGALTLNQVAAEEVFVFADSEEEEAAAEAAEAGGAPGTETTDADGATGDGAPEAARVEAAERAEVASGEAEAAPELPSSVAGTPAAPVAEPAAVPEATAAAPAAEPERAPPPVRVVVEEPTPDPAAPVPAAPDPAAAP